VRIAEPAIHGMRQFVLSIMDHIGNFDSRSDVVIAQRIGEIFQ
jgi:hypothetical protein